VCPQLSPFVPNCPRVSPDINELNLPKTCEIDFSDQDDLLHFRLLICPDEVRLGLATGATWATGATCVGQGYPHDPPKVKCETMVYHPNIDLEGNVCLNILRWATEPPGGLLTPRGATEHLRGYQPPGGATGT
ncbi:UBC12 enzyme, partial [Dicaeum eximium]|nr:UBC12 enzyme [Dicaeum eximium]